MHHDLRVLDDAAATAAAGAVLLASTAADAVAQRGRCDLAVSGGTTPAAMFTRLATLAVPWDRVTIYQVDERVAPAGDPARNLTTLETCLADLPVRIEAMPVGDDDLDAAATAYAARLPARFDAVHLGIGADGHTASLVPGDPVLEVDDRLVAVTEPYQAHRRMTLTYPALSRADLLVWLVAGAEKRHALAQLLSGDTSIPAGRVTAARSVVLADAAAA
ncbi:MAG TPA: 6-phosphogluconolactonase [Acidimicrobiales bacterium]|nr:6-phosphogluconolactonase [Acidimicrobiales bacterium]